MADLALYIDESGVSRLHRSGFSWLAALSLPLWAASRRMWWACLLAGPVTIALHTMVFGIVTSGVKNELAQLALLLAWLIGQSWAAGRWANRWHRWVLERRGFLLTAAEPPTVQATPVQPA